MQQLHKIQIEPIIARALEEDWGYGDWTTDLTVEKNREASARIICKEDCIVAGIDIAAAVFHKVEPNLNVQIKVENGHFAKDRTEFLTVSGNARSILKAERIALNLMGRMCGIATITREFVKAMEGTKTQLLDTRKVTPGLRILEKSATVLGGARNHRFGLCDGALVKENHIRAAGGITQAVSRLREGLPPMLKIEVETTNLEEVKEALAAGADIIMFDNMSVETMREGMALVNGRAIVEASGNVRLNNVRAIAETGVNYISTSSIITAARWSDLSLLFDI